MQLRKAELIPTTNNKKVFRVKVDEANLICWRSDSEICTSDCAAWRTDAGLLMCMALPTDKRVAQIDEKI
jgi:hypothetical protein